MICPRCGNEWDASKSPCTRCGLVIRVPGQPGSGPLGRTSTPLPRSNSTPLQPGGMQPVRQQPGSSLGTPPNTMLSQQNIQSPPPAMRNSAVPKTPTSMPVPPPTSFSASQAPNTPLPFNFPATPTTDTTRSSTNSSPLSGFESRTVPQGQANVPGQQNQGQRQAFNQINRPHPRTDSLTTSRSVPQRPQPGMPLHRSTDSLIPELQRNTNPPRPSRLVTDPIARDSTRATTSTQSPTQASSSLQQNSSAPTQPPQNGVRAVGAERNSLPPGTILRGGRYRLYELQEKQEWLSNAYEAMWVAQDAQRGAAQVIICEVALPDSNPMVVQTILRSSTMALTSVGRHPHIATLSDAFSDKGRHFFVFEPVEGESLLSRMRRTGRAMQEQEVIECCLQMTEVLELLAQQTPPLVHGMIRPEHIIVGRGNSGYVLTSFSILMAGGATQFIAGIDRTRLSVYSAPELTRGVIDVRSDLFSLIATAYHAVTGSIPASVSGSVPQAQRLNPNISPQFDAILSKGLRPIASQRYQRPSELRQELLAMRSVNGSLVSGTGQRFDQPASRVPDFGQSSQRPAPTSTATTASPSRVPDSVAQAFQSLAPADDLEEQKLLLPRPEELPPLDERNNTLHAALWLSAILVCLILLIYFGRGFF